MSNPLEEIADEETQEGLIGGGSSSGNYRNDYNNHGNESGFQEGVERHMHMSRLNTAPMKSETLDFSSPELEEKNENAFLQNYALQQGDGGNNASYGRNGEPLPSLNTSEVFFSPSSTSSQNWKTPTLKVEDHDVWQDMLDPSPISHPDAQLAEPFQNDRRYLSTSSWQPETDSYASDLDSDIGGAGSVYHTPNLTAQDATIASPAMSYLTTGDDEVDDLLSVKSDLSGNSNCMLPVDSRGYKHVTNMNELDSLLTVINDHFDLEFNDLGTLSIPNNNLALRRDMDMEIPVQQQSRAQAQSQSIQPPPVISIQEFPEQPTLNGEEEPSFKEPLSSPSPDESVPLQRQRDKQHGTSLGHHHQQLQQQQLQNALLCPTDALSDANYEQMRSGRIKKRRASYSSRRSPRASRSSSISPDEKARSLSEDSDRLLELADLQLPSPIPSRHNSSNSGNNDINYTNNKDNNNDDDNASINNIIKNNGNSMNALEEGETLQNLSGNTKKRLSQKNPAAFACDLCGKRFTRPYNLKSHLRTHTNERPFECSICSKAFARQHDRKRHEDLHTGKKRYVCGGTLKDGSSWGCGKKFARSDALGRHFKTESGRRCIVPLYEEASREKGFIPDLHE